MTVAFYRNQYADGGALEAEKWELFDASNISRVYGSCYSLERKDVELPEGFTAEENNWGKMTLYDNGDACELVYHERIDRMDAVSVYGVTRIW